LKASSATQLRKCYDNRLIVDSLSQVSHIQDLFEQGDIEPVAFAFGFLASNKIGQRKEGHQSPAVTTFFAARIHLIERRQQVVSAPEFKPFLAAIFKPTDTEPAKIIGTPAGPFLEHAAIKKSATPQFGFQCIQAG
jgi:hypothetical protein